MPCGTTAVRSTSPAGVTSAALLLNVPMSMPSSSSFMKFRSGGAGAGARRIGRYARGLRSYRLSNRQSPFERGGNNENASVQDAQRHQPEFFGDRSWHGTDGRLVRVARREDHDRNGRARV